jgi:hypothetical protein
MRNYEQLVSQTSEDQLYLLESPIIGDVAAGAIDLPMYQAFLTNAYHHVRYTVPLMMAAGARVSPARTTLMRAFREYIDEEIGHEQWILDDLKATGADASAVAQSLPPASVEVMVAYVRDYIAHVNPLGFFGMVHVLEGTSTSLATATADLVQQQLDLPGAAFSYLRSHGDLDLDHVEYFKSLLDEFTDAEMEHVIHVAKRVYHLYGDVLRSVPRKAESETNERACVDAA